MPRPLATTEQVFPTTPEDIPIIKSGLILSKQSSQKRIALLNMFTDFIYVALLLNSDLGCPIPPAEQPRPRCLSLCSVSITSVLYLCSYSLASLYISSTSLEQSLYSEGKKSRVIKVSIV